MNNHENALRRVALQGVFYFRLLATDAWCSLVAGSIQRLPLRQITAANPDFLLAQTWGMTPGAVSLPTHTNGVDL